MGEPLADGPVSVVTSAVLDDGNVAGLTGRCTLVVGLERVVLLIDDDVRGIVASEFTDFDLFNVGKLVPVSVSALVSSDPDILPLVEVALSIVVQDRHGVGSVRGDGHVVVAITIEIADGDIHGITVGGVGSCYGCTGGGRQSSGGAEHHEQRQENAAHSGLREVVLGKHGHHLVCGRPVRI